MKKGLLHAILASTLWATVNSFIKQELSYDFTPMISPDSTLPLLKLFFSLIPDTRVYDRNHLNLYYYSKHCMDCKVSISFGTAAFISSFRTHSRL